VARVGAKGDDVGGQVAEVVLVVDDERGTVALISEMLEYAGFRVAQAYDGLEALARARELRPAMVLSDIMMPGMDGRDLCRELRADPALRETVVVLHSSMDESEVEWRTVGADGFLQKPFRISELPGRVRNWLQQRRNGRTSG
jgi:DNA-binding response OmpR family regulator